MRLSLWVKGTILLVVLGSIAGTARADCPLPAQIKRGTEARFYLPSLKEGYVLARLEKIDKAQCWAKVKVAGSSGVVWINLREVQMISVDLERE